MAKKDRFPGGRESEGSGSSGRIHTEIPAASGKKWITLNSASQDGFGVPVRVLPLSKMSLSDRQDLLVRLTAELEQIRVIRRNLESQKANVVSLSSSGTVKSNRQNVVTNGNMRSSALSGDPGKTLDPSSNKARGWNRSKSGRFKSSSQPSVPLPLSSALMKQCESLLKKLMSHEYGWMFNTPVDVVKWRLPDYFDVIKHPMDLGTIKRKISSCEYTSPLDFAADVRLTFANAMMYNPAGNDAHVMADTLSKFFEVRWKVIEKKLSVNISQPLPHASGLHLETEKVKPVPASKKRKLSSTQNTFLPESVRESVKRVMTAEDKQKLSRELESSLGDLPDNIIEFLKDKSSTGEDTGEDEIEIDIDALGDDTLFELQKLLDDYLTEKQKRARGEPCEIELLNEPGFSNSSLQPDKGNELIGEVVDIGGNEPPVSSYSPVKIQKDSGYRSNKCTSPGTSSECRSFSAVIPDVAKASAVPVQLSSDDDTDHGAELEENVGGVLVDGNLSGLDQLEPSKQKPNSFESDCCRDERPLSPDKRYRVAVLKNRFADTILKAQEKTIKKGEKVDPERLQLEREELESQKRKEKARLQAEAKAAEDARRQAEAEAAAESKRQRELEREAARQALLKMEKTVEINGTSRFLEDLEMLRAVPPEPSEVETSPDQSLDCFNFGGSNPLEKLGLYMKDEEDDEEIEPPSKDVDVEEGEID